jgi:hypothetical protein
MAWDLRLYFPSGGRCAAEFYRPLNSITLARFETATFGSSDKHTNNYTTKATKAVGQVPLMNNYWKFLNVSSHENLGDVFTKVVCGPKTKAFNSLLGLVPKS